MSNFLTENISDIEEGEIHSDEDGGYPAVTKRPNLNLEDLSSCDEVFSSDSITSHVHRKHKHYTKVSGRENNASSQLKEKEVPKEKEKPSVCKRNVARKRVQAAPRRVCSRAIAKVTDRKVRPSRRLPRRECSVSFSSESENESRKISARGARRRPRRVRSDDNEASVAHKLNNSETSHAKKVVQKRNGEPPESVLVSCPEKAVPKTSLKRRLMNMLTFATAVSNEADDQGMIPSGVAEDSEVDPISATKESVPSEPVINVVPTGKKRKQATSNSENEICQGVKLKRPKEAFIDNLNVEHAKTEEKDVVAESSPKAPEIAATDEGETKGADDPNDTTVTGDEDLAELRKLALESSVMMASKKKVPVKAAVAVVASEEADDLTELRLQALRSAVLKKHIARKAKAAAAAAACSAAATMAQFASPVPILGQPAPALATPALAPALSAPALAPPAHMPASTSLELRQAHAAAWNSDGYQCADNCDKTTLIVDMDLGNTSDEDSIPPESVDSCMQLCKDSSSPYYIPELWTPIVVEDQESQSVDGNFNGSSYQSNGDYNDLSTPLNQSMHIPFSPSIYDTQQVPNMLPIVVPPLMYQQQVSPNLEAVSTTHRNKYSERPNLIKLSVAPMRSERQVIPLTNLSGVESYPCSETSISSYTNSKNNSRVSSLINIDLQPDSTRNVVNPNDQNESNRNCSKWKETQTRDNQRLCPTDSADTSDTENMDITSMIVVDEIVCTSPEPDSGKNSNHASSVSQGVSNVLTDVPVPSSQYANRSMLPNNAPSTTRVVKSPIKSPITMFKQKVLPKNPFMLNNVKREFLKHKSVNSTVLPKRAVALSPATNINVVVPSRPNLEVTKPNQMPFISTRGLVNNSPTANKGSPGRFVIHLGDDSDSDDDGQTVNQEFFPLPKRTIINERALQKVTNLNQPSIVSPLTDPTFSANLDAFLKDTRAKYDRKAALMKQTKSEEALRAASSTQTVAACPPNRPVSVQRTVKMPGKQMGAGNALLDNSGFSRVRTVVQKVKPPEQMPRNISITASATSRTVKNTTSLLIGRNMEAVSSANANSALMKQSNIEEALRAAGSTPTVAACPPNRPVSVQRTVMMPGKQMGAGNAVPDNSSFFKIRTVVQQMPRRICITASETGRTVKNQMVLLKERKSEVVAHVNADVPTRRTVPATPGEEKRTEPSTLVNLSTPPSNNAKMASNRLKLMRGVSSIAGEMPGKAEAPMGTISATNVGSISTANSLVKFSAMTVKRTNTNISMVNTSTTGCGTGSKEKIVDISGSASGVDNVPKKLIRRKVSGNSSTIAKPQALNSSNLKTIKSGTPSPIMPVSDEKSVLADSIPAPPAILSSKQPNALALKIEKPASTNNVQALKTGQCSKPLVAPLRPLSSSKASTLRRVLIKSPVLSTVRQESQVAELKNIMDIETAPQQAVNLKTQVNQNTTLKMDEVTLELTENKLLEERTALLLDLTFILDHLNDSSKVEHAINEMQETISQQKKIIELAKRSIKLTHERIACETKKRAQTFNLINDKRKTVTFKRDLCNKLRDECINLGSKMKGQLYMAPKPLEAELRMRLEEVAAGISNTMRGVSPQKKVTPPQDRSPNGAESPVVGSTVISVPTHAASGSAQSQLPTNHEASGETYRQILWLMDCPYEINGICGDVADCPFVHTKHR